jgi:hypothetical protein
VSPAVRVSSRTSRDARRIFSPSADHAPPLVVASDERYAAIRVAAAWDGTFFVGERFERTARAPARSR